MLGIFAHVQNDDWRIWGHLRYELDMGKAGPRVVAARIGAFDDGLDFDTALSGVSAVRRGKALAYRFDKDRRLSLLAGLLLDALLRERGLREHDMAYVIGEHGKPAFRDFPGLHFSLAHSGEMAVAALADAPIGVDVERLSDFPHEIAESREWTAMESVGKALGCGVGLFVDGGGFAIPQGMCVEHVDLGDYLVCVAVQSPVRPVSCYTSQRSQEEGRP